MLEKQQDVLEKNKKNWENNLMKATNFCFAYGNNKRLQKNN